MSTKTAKADVTPVRQRTQYSCMAASMAMCLRALGHDVTEDEVNQVMGARPMKGAAWEQALATAQHYGCRATLTMPSTVEQLKAWTDAGIPVMIAWNPEGRPWSHASVVFDVDDERNVHVADPNIPNPTKTVRIVSEDEFYGKWYEKFPDYLVRRPACAIQREITVEGRQVMASQSNKQAARVLKPGDRVFFWNMVPTKDGQNIKPKTEGTVTKVDMAFTPYGPKEEAPVYDVELDDGRVYRRIAWHYFESKAPKLRDPLEQAFKLVMTALKPFNLKRTNSRQRNGRRLEADSRKTVLMADVQRAMASIPGVKASNSNRTFLIPIRVREDEVQPYEATLRPGFDQTKFDHVELYMGASKMASMEDRVAARHLARAKKKNKPESMKTRMKVKDTETRPRNPIQQIVNEQGGMSGGGTHQNKGTRGEGTKGKGKAQRHPKHKKDLRREVQGSRARYEDWAKIVPGADVPNSNEEKALRAFWDFTRGEMIEAIDLDGALDMVAWDMGYQGRNLRFAPGLPLLAKIRRRPVNRSYKDGQAAAKENKTAARYTNGWESFKDGWKFVDEEIWAYLLWEDVWDTVKDRDIPDVTEVADPEMVADRIPESEAEYNRRVKEWEKWNRQGWWPRPVKDKRLHLSILHRPTSKAFEAWFRKNEARKALDLAEKAVDVVRGKKYPRWMSPMKLADTDSRYKGNPNGLPVYDHVIDHGVDQPLSGGHDVMKALQNEYLKEQGREPRETNPRLAGNRFVGAARGGGAPVDRQTRSLANRALIKAGLDGNGRFRKPEHAYAKALDVLAKFGIELDEVVSSHLFQARPSGTLSVQLAFSNPEDSFSPTSITNSTLYLQFTELRKDVFEVVGYLS